MPDDDIRDAEIVTPAVDAAPAASVVVDGLPPQDKTSGIVPDIPITTPDEVVSAPPPKRGLRAMLPPFSGKLLVGQILVLGILLFAIVAPLLKIGRASCRERVF